jgi:hypothetical protein
MQSTVRRYAGLLALAALAGCDSNRVSAPETSRFQASVQGSVASSFEGRGFFRLTSRPAFLPGQTLSNSAAPGSFVLFSAEPNAASRQVQSFALIRLASAVPAVGTYPLSALTGLGAGEGFHAVYSRAEQGRFEQYAGRAGEVRITASSADRIQGTFRFQGVRVCTATAEQVMCAFPRMDGTGAAEQPTVEVSGSFTARQAPAHAAPPLGL